MSKIIDLQKARKENKTGKIPAGTLYDMNKQIMQDRNMEIQQVFGKFDGTPGSNNEIQMIVCSEKLKEENGG